MKPRIRAVLISAEDPLENWSSLELTDADVVVPAFYSPPEAIDDLLAAGARRVVAPFEQPPFAEADQRAKRFRTASALVDEMPLYREVAPLRGQETTIATAISQTDAASWFTERLVAEVGPLELRTAHDSAFARALARQPAVRGGSVLLNVPSDRRDSWTARRARSFATLAKEVRVTHDYARLWYLPLEVTDQRFLIRSRARRRRRTTRGGLWAYTSYVNYSSALLGYPETSGGRWLSNGHDPASRIPAGVPTRHLWEFGRPGGARPHRVIERAFLEFMVGSDPSVRGILEHLVARTLPNVLAEIDCLHSFFDSVAPDQVWTANQWGSEATVLETARLRAVPTVQVQHGVLEEYYSTSQIRSDRFLVWGEAWRDAVPASERERTEIRDPRATRPLPKLRGGCVTFFTQPFTPAEYVNPWVYRREAVRSLATIARTGARTIVRVHPRDSVDGWRSALKKWAPSERVELDSRGPLDDVIRRTRVAVTVSSTVFLECLRHGVPVVASDSYPIAWKTLLEEEGALAFAGSSKDVVRLVLQAEPTDPSTFSRLLASLTPGEPTP
jgi:hypothetical protein